MVMTMAQAATASADGKDPKAAKGHHDSAKPGEHPGAKPGDKPGHEPGDKPGKPMADDDKHPHGPRPGASAEGERPSPEAMMARKKHMDELLQKEKENKLTEDEKKELQQLKQDRPHHDHGLHGAKRKARIEELKQKGDKLTDDEKKELEKAEKAQARHEEVDKKLKEKAETRKLRLRDAKRQALKDAPTVGKDAAVTAEYKKHAERLAKLERAKELASADENTDAVQRVDSLIAKENARHQSWMGKHQPAKSEGASK
jgi:hypothetical protein